MFIKLAKKVFGDDFIEEQTYFRISLIFFLSTYSIRLVLVGLEIGFWNEYVEQFEETPILGGIWQQVSHMCFDFVPVVHIMLRHQKTYSPEEE